MQMFSFIHCNIHKQQWKNVHAMNGRNLLFYVYCLCCCCCCCVLFAHFLRSFIAKIKTSHYNRNMNRCMLNSIRWKKCGLIISFLVWFVCIFALATLYPFTGGCVGAKMCVSMCNAENDPLMLRNGFSVSFLHQAICGLCSIINWN